MLSKDRAEAKEYVLKIAKEQDVKFMRMWFTDILGFLKSFAITSEELEAVQKQRSFWTMVATSI